jgi:hypothetical protein
VILNGRTKRNTYSSEYPGPDWRNYDAERPGKCKRSTVAILRGYSRSVG